MTCTAEAQSGEPSATIVLSPPFRLKNDCDRILFYVPVNAEDGTWLENARPQRIQIGEEQPLYWTAEEGALGIAFASLPWTGEEPTNLYALDWSATVRLDISGQSLVPIPLMRGADASSISDDNSSSSSGENNEERIAPIAREGDGFFCGWALQTVVTVKQGGAINLARPF